MKKGRDSAATQDQAKPTKTRFNWVTIWARVLLDGLKHQIQARAGDDHKDVV